jgi:hypothetical protein
MAMTGNLDTMSLADLLVWASENGKTGVLELERNRICRRIAFEAGRIVACSSDDPPSRLGQFLLSRGKITREILRDALARQEQDGQPLGAILRGMGALTDDEIEKLVREKAEENIYGLFEWPGAVFRFEQDEAPDPWAIAVDLEIEEVLRKGARRHEELERIRTVLRSPGVVLARTSRPTPPEVQVSPMAARILETVNGERTLAEVLLHAHASEFLVIKFLYNLHQRGVIEITGERAVETEGPTLLETETEQQRAPVSEEDLIVVGEVDAQSIPQAESTGEPPRLDEDDEASRHHPELSAEIQLAQQLTSSGDHDAALQVLKGCYRTNPGDGYLRHLILKAESAYLDQARQDDLSPSKIPVPIQSLDSLTETNPQPTELYLIDLIDGKTNIKSILWVAPMREVDIFLALQRMRQKRLIELRDPDELVGTGEGGPKAVQWA